MTPTVGKSANDLIVSEEIGSESLYTARYQHPSWPGGSSGATVGIGYDLGQQTAEQIADDWRPYVDAEMLALMVSAAGVHGAAAHAVAYSIRAVTIPITTAKLVFLTSTLPRYARGTDEAMDNCDNIHPDAFGALVSISYNRGFGGWDMDDDRHKEMLAISDAMTDGEYQRIPDLILAMQRLWPAGSDLWKRRAAESFMFARAIAK